MNKIICKECGKEMIGMRFLQHLRFHHNIDSYFDYAKKYNIKFERKYCGIYEVVDNFENKCKLCGNKFNLSMKDSDTVEINKCLTKGCSKNSLKNSLLQCLYQSDDIFKRVYDRFITNQKNRFDIHHISIKKRNINRRSPKF